MQGCMHTEGMLSLLICRHERIAPVIQGIVGSGSCRRKV